MSNGLNKVVLIGAVGRDPEVRDTHGGKRVANFTLATNETWRDKDSGERKEKTEWHRIVAFGPVVAIVEAYVRKGSRVAILGKLRTREWADQQGNKRSVTEISVEGPAAELLLLDGPRPDVVRAGDGGGAAPPPRPKPGGMIDDDIPFAPEWR